MPVDHDEQEERPESSSANPGGGEAQEELALLAECMREASAALGRITGAVDVEDVLDHIFSRFCIGK